MIRVIGQRFELNDPFVSILGELELEHQREPRNSIRREIERAREDKQKETGAGILSTIFEGIGISQSSQKSTSDKPVGEEQAIGAESGAENQENADEVPEESEEGGETEVAAAAAAAAAEETEEAVVAGAAAEGGENEQ